MGDYPRLASFDLDTERFCARILKMNPNPLENKMAQYHDDEWIDVDDGMIDIESFGEMIEDFHEDDYYDDSMDGDFDSAMRDAGFGTDEDYGYYGEDY
jgi:hypothetical protein